MYDTRMDVVVVRSLFILLTRKEALTKLIHSSSFQAWLESVCVKFNRKDDATRESKLTFAKSKHKKMECATLENILLNLLQLFEIS